MRSMMLLVWKRSVMNSDANPYQAPQEVEVANERDDSEREFWRSKFIFWAATGCVFFGSVSLFFRNVQPGIFLLVGLLLFGILLVGSRQYRKRSAVGVLLTLILFGGAIYRARSIQSQIARQRAMQAQMAAQQALQRAQEQMNAQTGEIVLREGV